MLINKDNSNKEIINVIRYGLYRWKWIVLWGLYLMLINGIIESWMIFIFMINYNLLRVYFHKIMISKWMSSFSYINYYEFWINKIIFSLPWQICMSSLTIYPKEKRVLNIFRCIHYSGMYCFNFILSNE